MDSSNSLYLPRSPIVPVSLCASSPRCISSRELLLFSKATRLLRLTEVLSDSRLPYCKSVQEQAVRLQSIAKSRANLTISANYLRIGSYPFPASNAHMKTRTQTRNCATATYQFQCFPGQRYSSVEERTRLRKKQAWIIVAGGFDHRTRTHTHVYSLSTLTRAVLLTNFALILPHPKVLARCASYGSKGSTPMVRCRSGSLYYYSVLAQGFAYVLANSITHV